MTFKACTAAFLIITASLFGQNGNRNRLVVFFVHGDGDYVYYDKGIPLNADSEILKKISETAAELTSENVFVFYHGEKKSSFFIFPKEESWFRYYSDGKLVNEGSYFRGTEFFSDESEIIATNLYSKPDQTYFFYYGHQIPEIDQPGYYVSEKERIFGAGAFADGLKKTFGEIDLLVLSTCNNGSPLFVNNMLEIADYIIASPGTIHLSYITPLPLTFALEKNDPEEAAMDYLTGAFEAIPTDIYTQWILVLYNRTKIKNYISADLQKYNDYINDRSDLNTQEYCDCNDHIKLESDGLTVLYKPPLFGIEKDKTLHSGWGCPEKIIDKNMHRGFP